MQVPVMTEAPAPLHRRMASLLARVHDVVFGPPRDAASDLYSFLFHRRASYGAIGLILLAAALPSDGAGIPICLFRYLTGLPCPGCGLTRSFSSILHLHFAAAYDYQPFGFLFLPLFALVALHLFLPARVRERCESFLRSHHALARRVYWGAIYGFVIFGLLRVAIYAVLGLQAT